MRIGPDRFPVWRMLALLLADSVRHLDNDLVEFVMQQYADVLAFAGHQRTRFRTRQLHPHEPEGR